ncbi:MAG: tRNA 2-thiouridine(34) synthase MnmA [Bordetella sp.]|nr:MAG: tRNA 2-thiouridine(34) synthase MnmA [Bordetella sp.]
MSKIHFKKGRVVVGMSGGVDSSISAWCLKQQGYEVVGLFMKNWQENLNTCSTKDDLLDAISVADFIGIEFECVDFTSQYKDRVFKNFLSEYSIGRTPNPDVFCNSEIKFQSFMEYAFTKLKADYIATGHYAQIQSEKSKRVKLLKAIDESKDQSYFLYRLNQSQLLHTIFPLGKILKNQVRKIAKEIGLHNAKKKDSTGICFIGKRSFREFLKNYIPLNPGPILNSNKKKIGNHEGLHFYTIGQRKGLGIGGIKEYQLENNQHRAWYVASKDFEKNILFIVQGQEHPWLFSRSLLASQITWIKGTPPKDSEYKAKIRFRQKDVDCFLKKIDNESFQLKFGEPQWAVTPGQSVVIYNKSTCLGGGIIC